MQACAEENLGQAIGFIIFAQSSIDGNRLRGTTVAEAIGPRSAKLSRVAPAPEIGFVLAKNKQRATIL
jgi:hypothetical protein